MRGITRDSLVEMFDRKIFYVFAVVTVLAILIVVLSGSMDINLNVHTEGNMDMEDMNEMFGDPVVKVFEFYLSFLVFMVVLGTAGLIPTMLEKGRADYYLSKPLSRTSLFLNKFFGVFIIYGLTIVISGLIVYAGIGLIHGLFNARIVYLFLFSLISLFIWLSITSFAGVVFGSSAIAVMSAFIIWILQKILTGREWFESLIDSQIIKYAIDTLYYIIPKTSEISDISVRMVTDRAVHDWTPLYSSVLFALVLIYATLFIFKRKNY